MKFSFGYML